MTPAPPDFPIHISSPEDVRILRAFGDELTVLLDASHTGGAFSLFLAVTSPGGGPPPHYHLKEDETFYVLEGKAEFFRDGEWIAAGPGTTVFLPKRSVHTFRNPSTEAPLKTIIQVTPSGFEDFFGACAEIFTAADGGEPDMEKIVVTAEKYGLHFPAPSAE